jgi:hypothetical protein
VPVEQNVQASPQPTCDETHSVPRLVSGMNTASIALPLSMPSSHLYVASAACFSNSVLGGTISAAFSSFSRSALPISVIAENSVTRRW